MATQQFPWDPKPAPPPPSPYSNPGAFGQPVGGDTFRNPQPGQGGPPPPEWADARNSQRTPSPYDTFEQQNGPYNPMQGFNGSPTSMQYPGFTQSFTKGDFTQPQIEKNLSGLGEGLRGEATRTGMSPYSMLRMSRAAQGAGAQTASQRGALATRGGLSSGAAERVGETGAQNALSMQENIGAQDAQQRQQAMKDYVDFMTERSRQLGSAGQFDVSQLGNQANLYNEYKQGLYKQMGSMIGAQNTANAMGD